MCMPNLHNSFFCRLALATSMFLMLVRLTLVLWILHQEMSPPSKQPLLPLVQSQWQWMPAIVPFSFTTQVSTMNPLVAVLNLIMVSQLWDMETKMVKIIGSSRTGQPKFCCVNARTLYLLLQYVLVLEEHRLTSLNKNIVGSKKLCLQLHVCCNIH